MNFFVGSVTGGTLTGAWIAIDLSKAERLLDWTPERSWKEY